MRGSILPKAGSPSDPDSEERPADWKPMLARRKGATKHKVLTERIIADIDAEILPAQARMPTHRELARRLGVSVQTVSISYKEAERRGYLRGEVGRGTFVRSRITEKAERFMLDRNPGEAVDLSIVRAAYTQAHEDASRSVLMDLSRGDNSAFMRPCRPIAGLDRHRSVARSWLRMLGVDAAEDRILITNGTAHGLFLAVAAIVQPGEIVLTENLTDHGIIGLANVLGFTLRGSADGSGRRAGGELRGSLRGGRRERDRACALPRQSDEPRHGRRASAGHRRCSSSVRRLRRGGRGLQASSRRSPALDHRDAAGSRILRRRASPNPC